MIVALGRSALHTKQGLCRVTCCMDYIQVLEDMLRACVLDHKGSWEEQIALSGIRLQQQLSGECANGTI